MHIRWRKRADRAAQLALLAAAATAAAQLACAALGLAARALARTALGAALRTALPANGALAALGPGLAAAAAALFARRRMGADIADVLAEQNTESEEGVRSGTRPGY